jgi:hypothetical protein
MKMLSFLFFAVCMQLFFTSCKDDADNTQAQIEDNVESGTWRITEFIDSGDPETHHFTGFNFTFSEGGSVTATNGTLTYTGTWSVTDSNSNDDGLDDLDFNISFPQTNEFQDLNDDWDLLSQSSTRIELTDVSGGGGGTDFLTFQKN